MGLAAAEVGLELHHRIPARARQALYAPHQQVLEALREVGAPVELLRVSILIASLAQMHLPQVRCELRLLIVPAGHIRVRGSDLAPRPQTPRRSTLNSRSGLLRCSVRICSSKRTRSGSS